MLLAENWQHCSGVFFFFFFGRWGITMMGGAGEMTAAAQFGEELMETGLKMPTTPSDSDQGVMTTVNSNQTQRFFY